MNPLIPAYMARVPTPTVRHDPAVTHETFLHAVRDAVLSRVKPADRARLGEAKLTYGAGSGAYRGICVYDAWTNGSAHAFIEIAASGEESPVQLAGTTVHELGHVLAGSGAGHGAAWRAACKVLGLDAVSAAGQDYQPAHFAPELWWTIERLPFPTDGRPTFHASIGVAPRRPLRPCPLGRGTRGGRSRGPGSGSRLRLWECSCQPPIKARVARDQWDATCNVCQTAYTRKG
jgi:hypothetical protein